MNERILLVSHEPESLSPLERILPRAGYQVCTASEEKILEVLQCESFDLVILDIQMQRPDGLQFTDRVRSLYPDLEVIVLTGSPTLEGVIQLMRDHRAFDLFIKPLESMDALLHSIAEALERRRLSQEREARVRALEEANRELAHRVEALETQWTRAQPDPCGTAPPGG